MKRMPDQGHLFVKAQPTDAQHFIVGQLKGYTSYKLHIGFPELISSLLSNTPKGKEHTITDREILKYHYSYGIRKGTPLEAFEHTHKAYQEMIKENPNSQFNIIPYYEYFI